MFEKVDARLVEIIRAHDLGIAAECRRRSAGSSTATFADAMLLREKVRRREPMSAAAMMMMS